MIKDLSFGTVRTVEPHLISDAKRLITLSPPPDLAEAQHRIRSLASAVVALADQCADLQDVILALVKHAQSQETR